ncbi:hypothetical protein [Pseudactinotalea sp.]|uniref:hypothetical protein n=1 Tax=Pseudactinotalea sp. TaxID=1926260 RepID=UPI003B3A3181
MGDKYAVDNESAGKVATDTETAIKDLDDVKTTITDELTNAEGALPPEFSAVSRLATLRSNHTRDVTTIKTYATSCVGALRACLTVYENSSAEMVAEQKATEAKVTFEHGTAFVNGEADLNNWANGRDTTPGGTNNRGLAAVNENLPSTSENRSLSVSHQSVSARDGSSSTGYTGYSAESNGYSVSGKNWSTANTHNGVTDTTTYYQTTATGPGVDITSSGRDYTVTPANQGGPR